MKRRTRRSIGRWIALTAVVLASTAGIAIAAIPNGNTINACRNNTTFAVRIIDKDLAQACSTSETALAWTSWKYRGAYAATTAYNIADVVYYRSSSYLVTGATKPPAGTVPTNATYWSLVAQGSNYRGLWVSTASPAYQIGDEEIGRAHV